MYASHQQRRRPQRDLGRGALSRTALAVLGGAAGLHGGHVRADLIAGPDIIPAPAAVVDGATPNDHQQGFNERQLYVLPADVEVDPGGVFIPAGTVVSSHMIFFDSDTGLLQHDPDQTWRFRRPIIGTMSDIEGKYETASSAMLGHPATAYPALTLTNRGLEGPGWANPDEMTYVDNELRLSSWSSTPGDWIRVITDPCDRFMGFDGQPLGPVIVPPGVQAFVEDHIGASFDFFSTGGYGPAVIEPASPEFGQGRILCLPNINLILDLRHRCVEELVFTYADLGGFENLQVNGGPLWIGEIEAAPAAIAPGVTLSVGPPVLITGGERRTVRLTGHVRRLLVGGQEFWVDKFCAVDARCPGDIDCDGAVGFSDLVAVFSAWGPCAGPICPTDLDNDGVIGLSDALIVLANWGPC